MAGVYNQYTLQDSSLNVFWAFCCPKCGEISMSRSAQTVFSTYNDKGAWTGSAVTQRRAEAETQLLINKQKEEGKIRDEARRRRYRHSFYHDWRCQSCGHIPIWSKHLPKLNMLSILGLAAAIILGVICLPDEELSNIGVYVAFLVFAISKAIVLIHQAKKEKECYNLKELHRPVVCWSVGELANKVAELNKMRENA